MTKYTVFLEQTTTEDITTLDMTMDYISNPSADCIIYKNGTLLALNTDYTIGSVVQYPYFTTFTITFVDTVASGSVIRVEKTEEWNQWIAFKFPNLESRIEVLENKVTTATDIANRLSALESAITPINNSLVNLATLISNQDAIITPMAIDVSNLQNSVVNIETRLSTIEGFLGAEDMVAIDNNVLVADDISELSFDGNLVSSVKVEYEIMRRTGLEYRSSVGTLYIVCKDNGVWFTERGSQIIDLDGVTFSIATDINKVCTFSYVSDMMNGAGYIGYLKFRTMKFGV